MSYHSNFKWTFDEEVTGSLIEEICNGLEANKRYNKTGRYIECYGTFCLMDQIFLAVGKFLDSADYSDEAIKKLADTSPNPKKVSEILREVTAKMVSQKEKVES